jgi:hypothetical protein
MASGKTGPAFDHAEVDAEFDLEGLRIQERREWGANAVRKYPRFPVKAVGPRTTNEGDGNG